MTVAYLNPAAVTGMCDDLVYPRSPYASGYGPAIPTRHRIKLSDNRWRRVYVMQYGNAGTAYVNVNGMQRVLDNATEYAFMGALSAWEDLVNL
jgi:hypothetical protein